VKIVAAVGLRAGLHIGGAGKDFAGGQNMRGQQIAVPLLAYRLMTSPATAPFR
jgi:hypothetical protein